VARTDGELSDADRELELLDRCLGAADPPRRGQQLEQLLVAMRA
jgi:hypothetical protein